MGDSFPCLAEVRGTPRAEKSDAKTRPEPADKCSVSSTTFSPITLTGVSQYSTDFQNVLNRAVQIAQIPITALQNQDSNILQQQTLLGSLNSAVSDLAASLTSLGTTAANKAITATSSDPSTVTVSSSNVTAATTYTINSITSVAAAAAERSVAHYADSAATPVSATGTLKLVVGSQGYVFTPTTNSLVGIRDQINSLGAGVTASILTTSGGNYLSLSANGTGATTLQLIDDPITTSNPGGANNNLLTSTNQGTNAVFQLNGITINQTGNTVGNVIPGVTFNLIKASATPVTLSLASDPTQLSSALQDFVTKYNALHAQLTAQVGPAAGLLSGDFAVTQLQTELRQLASYRTSTGSVNGLSDLGITFDTAGKASFDQNTFDSLNNTQIADGLSFVGSAATGLGGFSASFTQFSDPISGLIKTEQDGLTRIDTSIQGHIQTLTDRLTLMQASLASQLQAADAAEAELQAQQKNLTANLQGLSLVLYGQNAVTLG